MILKQLFISLKILLFFTILTGLAYPFLITGIAQGLFPSQANGSLIYVNGVPVGSELIGQGGLNPKYFWSRPSATGGHPYNASLSGGSNYSVLNENLARQVTTRLEELKQSGVETPSIPVDLVTSSASGLDPHISVASALVQAGRVARERGIPLGEVNILIQQYTEERTLGFLGEPRVNVLLINLALDKQHPNP